MKKQYFTLYLLKGISSEILDFYNGGDPMITKRKSKLIWSIYFKLAKCTKRSESKHDRGATTSSICLVLIDFLFFCLSWLHAFRLFISVTNN